MRRTDLVQQLLRAGADVNAAERNGFTAWHWAAVRSMSRP
jgi:ankyrin repeat protein